MEVFEKEFRNVQILKRMLVKSDGKDIENNSRIEFIFVR